ncbi:methyltransferase domain-containing protein [Pseudodesulfovibrio sp. zrk46]|uniref:methyltransferase domain-containing protein n=1 Tax=Pseudodesulfovibrio sp. zrk46 TaxID=2725288 RepID=UPI0014499E70|nr:methyltransferase domain-containing protein [Pseudodesulfovibrio sp. zrk46]QJB56418.1 methyltransferase domain-containing protein [Pseudodesulfovibrio sp. zrk46]
MSHIAQDSLVTIYFTFTWSSTHARHVEHYLAKDVNFTRDILPLGVKSRMIGLKVGDSVDLVMDKSEVPEFKPGKVLDMPRARFQAEVDGKAIRPRIGRYYPKHFIEQVPGTRPDSDTPFRIADCDVAGFKADLNHPMAGREVTIHATVMEIKPPATEAGSLKRWPDIFFSGPGMQARLPETPTDYLGDSPFQRNDETGDAEFYGKPRMVYHLDKQAVSNVEGVYGEVLKDGMAVLDLMAGHVSHIPGDIKPASVVGLGMNMEELEANPVLTERVVRNLNDDPLLPFEDESFDAVICTVSVEYLTKPFEIFAEAARVLRRGGVFALTFSNRWFEAKVIRVWRNLHEFERVGLVSQYFVRTEKFEDLTTWSERGWPRPDDSEDRYAKELSESDPVYAVWGRKK